MISKLLTRYTKNNTNRKEMISRIKVKKTYQVILTNF